MARPWARFDDLRAGTALLCPAPYEILTAVRPDEVADVLQRVHDATSAGSSHRPNQTSGGSSGEEGPPGSCGSSPEAASYAT